MTEIELLIDLHKDAERQGPGSAKETKKALDLIGFNKTDNLQIADIGCGSGAQTIVLAQNTNGYITAIDIIPEFLSQLENRAMERGYGNRIVTMVKSMDDLQFPEEEFDLIWSEGALYNMGFEEGVREWRKFLKSGGYIAVSEISWITDSRPAEVEEHWEKEYPQIDTVSNKIRILEKSGYSPIAHFILPSYCWIDNYYRPLQKRFGSFINRNGNSDIAKSIIKNEKKEIEIYEKYKDYYGYVFYIAQKK